MLLLAKFAWVTTIFRLNALNPLLVNIIQTACNTAAAKATSKVRVAILPINLARFRSERSAYITLYHRIVGRSIVI